MSFKQLTVIGHVHVHIVCCHMSMILNIELCWRCVLNTYQYYTCWGL